MFSPETDRETLQDGDAGLQVRGAGPASAAALANVRARAGAQAGHAGAR
jgi:hypothetical protein